MGGAMEKPEIAVFGGGCFWCTEAVFENLRGVIAVMPGYTGGRTSNPSYEEVCSGKTGHAEAIRVEFDPAQISYRDLLTVFFATHDPTTLNRQGNDVGTQYRSIILASTSEQEREAKGEFESAIVTEVAPLQTFYEAESYHRRYYDRNSQQPYCQIVIDPKVTKLRARFQQLLQTS
jgi:peptide-methionine (S)-S-oxide reductase